MKAMLNTSDIKKLIKATRNFISKDDNRPLLNYIRLDFDKESMTVKAVAIDGYRLSEEMATARSIDQSFSAYIKPYLPVGIDNSYVILELKDNKCIIDAGHSLVGYEQPTGNRMDTDAIVKDLESKAVLFDFNITGELLISALKSMDSSERGSISFEYRGEHVPVMLKSQNSKRIVTVARKN